VPTLGAAAQQNPQALAGSGEANQAARIEVDPVFHQSVTHSLEVGRCAARFRSCGRHFHAPWAFRFLISFMLDWHQLSQKHHNSCSN